MATIALGRLLLDRHTRLATVDGLPFAITWAEFCAVELLVLARGAVVSFEALSQAALRHSWGGAYDRGPAQLVFGLRRKLRGIGLADNLILAVRGVGYWMRVADAPEPEGVVVTDRAHHVVGRPPRLH